MKTTAYTREFFDSIVDGSRESAREVVPLVLTLLKPKSVVDVGCGSGAWLKVFMEQGVDVFGCDGAYVDPDALCIPRDHFAPVDLNKPFSLKRRFDLCICLEVAEHLKPESADGFIDSLVRLAPCVMFSAAIPSQGGTQHINLRWPSYWAELFRRRGFVWLDPFRTVLWNNQNVKWWYRQNMFLYVAEEALQCLPQLERYRYSATDLQIIHPDILNALLHPARRKSLPRRLWHKVRRWLGSYGQLSGSENQCTADGTNSVRPSSSHGTVSRSSHFVQ